MLIKNTIALICVLTLASVAASQENKLYLLPVPKEIQRNGKDLEISANIAIQLAPNPDKTEIYAAKQVKQDLEKWLKTPSKIVNASNASPKDSTIFAIGKYDSEHVREALEKIGKKVDKNQMKPEGYFLATGQNIAVVAGTDNNGLLYGAFALIQLLRKENGKLFLPQIEIKNWPSIASRGIYNLSCYYGPFAAKARADSWLDAMARSALNLVPSRMYSIGYEWTNGVINEKGLTVAKAFVEDCHKRGMKAFGVFYFIGLCKNLKVYMCPSNPEHVKKIEDVARKYFELGFDGFIIQFDDIKNEHVEAFEKCEACKKNGIDSLGKMHAEWIRIIKNVSKDFKGKKFLECPYPYIGNYEWKKGYNKYNGTKYLKEYYSELDKIGRDNIDSFHCAFKEKEIEDLKKIGLKNYIWWFNSNGSEFWQQDRRSYKSIFINNRVFAGFINPLLGWTEKPIYDENNQKWFFSKDALKELRSIGKRAKGLYLCGGGEYRGRVGFGAYAWAPEAFDWDKLEPIIVARTLGPKNIKAYFEIKKGVRYLGRAYSNLSPIDPSFKAKDQELKKRFKKLESSYKELLDNFKAFQKQPRLALFDERFSQRIISQIKKDRKTMAEIFDSPDFIKVKIGTERTYHGSHGMNRPRHIPLQLDSKLASYVLDWIAYVDKDGSVRPKGRITSALGMSRPSESNWFKNGFFNLEVNGMSLGYAKPEFKAIDLSKDRQAIEGFWKLDYADVKITFSLTKNGALLMDGSIIPKGKKPNTLRIETYCVPSAGNWNWSPESMEKCLMTSLGEYNKTSVPYINTQKEHWLLFYDKINDYPFVNKNEKWPNESKGPCVLMAAPENIAWMQVNMSNRFITTLIHYKKGTKRFRLAFYDLNKTTNKQAIDYFQKNGERLYKEFNYGDSAEK